MLCTDRDRDRDKDLAMCQGQGTGAGTESMVTRAAERVSFLKCKVRAQLAGGK
jgi:hypothetical protein